MFYILIYRIILFGRRHANNALLSTMSADMYRMLHIMMPSGNPEKQTRKHFSLK